jgi:hypothetical protein
MPESRISGFADGIFHKEVLSIHRRVLIATGTPRQSACTMVFTVLLEFAEFLKFEIFSFAVISTTSFRLLSLLTGPVFSCLMG